MICFQLTGDYIVIIKVIRLYNTDDGFRGIQGGILWFPTSDLYINTWTVNLAAIFKIKLKAAIFRLQKFINLIND